MKKLVLLFILSSLLLGCEEPKITITILGENAASLIAMQELKDEYEKLNPNVKLDFKPNTFDDAFNKANQDFANKTGLYDIVMGYNFSLASFVLNDYVYNLDDLYATSNISKDRREFETDIFAEVWKEIGYFQDPQTGEIEAIGYPFTANANILVYNKKFFNDSINKAKYKEKYGTELKVPVTWDEYIQVAEFFTQPENGLYGVCLQGADTWVYGEFVTYLYSMGGKMMDKQYGWQGDRSTPLQLISPEAIKALEFHISLKPYNAGHFSNVDMFEHARIMKEGKTAMGMTWSDGIYPAYATKNGFHEDFGFAPIPGDVSTRSGGAYFVNKQTKYPKEVLDYILYLMQPETQIKLALAGLCSPLKSTYDDPAVKNMPYSDALMKSLDRSIYMMEAGAETNIVTEVVNNYVQRTWIGEFSAKDAINNMAKEIEKGRGELYLHLSK